MAGLGVEGDAHCGARVKHRSRVRVDPEQPNLRQVHLLQRELFDEVGVAGFSVAPGDIGENITTAGIDLLSLPVGATLRIGRDALVVLTGLRNPCGQIDHFAPGPLDEVRPRGEAGGVIRKAGVMGVVVQTGVVAPDDRIEVTLPPAPRRALEPV
ncbi:MOSC domain-containing protein [soil metagenome]